MSTESDPRQHPYATLGVLAIGTLAYSLSQTTVAPALPEIQHGLGVSASAVAWVLTAYLVAASVMTAILGRLGDTLGKKRVLVWTLVAFAVGSAVCAVADSIGLLIVGRVIQGAAGGLFPLAFGIIRDEFPREKVAAGIGMISAILGVGGGLGLVIGGLIVDHASWHWIFWLGLAMTVVAVVATQLLVPESPVRRPGRIDWAGATLLTVGLSLPLVGVSQGPGWGWGDSRTLGTVAAGLAVLALFVRFERGQAQPLIDMRTLGRRPVLLTNAATLFVGFAMFASFVLIPQIAQLPRSTGFGLGASATVAGLLMLPSTITMLVAAPLSGRFGGTHGSKRPLVVGALATSVSLALMAIGHGHAGELLFWAALQGAGIGIAFAAMPNLIIEVVAQDQTGEATAVNTLLRNVGASIGAQVAGTILAAKEIAGTEFPVDGAFTIAFLTAAAAGLVAAVIGTAIPARRRDLGPGDPVPAEA